MQQSVYPGLPLQFWRDSPDFVRMAARLDAVIIPFAAVGADDAYDLALDSQEILQNPILGPVARNIISRQFPGTDPAESVTPVAKLPLLGLPTPFPVPSINRLYFR